MVVVVVCGGIVWYVVECGVVWCSGVECGVVWVGKKVRCDGLLLLLLCSE